LSESKKGKIFRSVKRISPRSARLHDDFAIAENILPRTDANPAPDVFIIGKSGFKPG